MVNWELLFLGNSLNFQDKKKKILSILKSKLMRRIITQITNLPINHDTADILFAFDLVSEVLRDPLN